MDSYEDQYQRWNIRGNFLGVVVMCVGLPVATSIFLWWLSKILSERTNLLREGEGQTVQPPKRGLKSELVLLSSSFTLWYAITVAGAVMFAVSYGDIFELLNRYLPVFHWELVTRFLEILCIVIIILDTLFTVLIWMPSLMLQKRMWHMYYLLTGDNERAKKYKVLHPIPFRGIRIGYIICFGFLLLSMMLAVLFVVVSVAVVGFSFGFSEACYTAADPLDGVCIDLSAFGGDEIECGAEFEQFCTQWMSIESSLILWGSCVVAVGHYFLIGIGGMSFYQHGHLYHRISCLQQSIECADDGIKSDQSNNECSEGDERISSALLNVTSIGIGTMNRSSGASTKGEASTEMQIAYESFGVEAANEPDVCRTSKSDGDVSAKDYPERTSD